MSGRPSPLSQVELFMRHVSPEPMSGCWLWEGTVPKSTGYGMYTLRGKKSNGAHRVAYELFKAPIPEGLDLDHKCRVRCCVNPDHLEPVTRKENLRRGLSGGRTHCKHGHPFDETNTWLEKNGARHCRACHRRVQAGRNARIRNVNQQCGNIAPQGD